MRGLLIIAHGSRREASNEEIRNLARNVAMISDHKFDVVSHAFLEAVKPSIDESIASQVKNNVSCIHVLPYFLAAGRHVIEDIPRLVTSIAKEHPDIEIKMRPHFGTSENIARELLLLSQ